MACFYRRANPGKFIMKLQKIQGQGFRNYSEFTFHPSPSNTIIIGDNGSGKTSLLEAIYLLGSGKSFRTPRLRHLLYSGAESLNLYAEFTNSDILHRCGLSRDKQQFTGLRLDGETIPSISSLAKLFPVYVFHSDSVDVVYSGPDNRRKFIDWGLFHVEQSFHQLWKDLNRVVKQRNNLLKQYGINENLVHPWNEQLAAISDRIARLREQQIQNVVDVYYELCDKYSLGVSIKFEHYPGWSEKNGSLYDQLIDSFSKDSLRGYTSFGAHRADLKMTLDGVPIKECLSRGQIKTVSMLLGLAQLSYLIKNKNLGCLILLDDMASELDEVHVSMLLEHLDQLGEQTILTALSVDEIPKTFLAKESTKMFHVEHGILHELHSVVQSKERKEYDR